MRTIILGDIHLRDLEESVDWSYNHKGLLNFLTSLKIEKNDIVIQLGDFFDKPKHKGVTNYVGLSAMGIMRNAKHVYVLQGNHDYTKYSGSNLSMFFGFENVTIIRDILNIKINDLGNCLFLPHIEGLTLNGKYEEKINSLISNDQDYIFGHHFFKENSIFDTPYLNTDLLKLKYKYFFQGHVHNFEKLGSNNYCIGSVSQCNKGERNQSKYYLEIIDNEIITKEIDKSKFSQFIEVEWGNEKDIEEKDFVLLSCSCKKEEKNLIEQEIRKKYANNLYFIDWKFEGEDKNELVEISSEDDLINKFFKENKFSSSVKDLVYSYF